MLKKIIQNLETGNYQIKYREHCDCEFYWHLNDGELDCDIRSTDGDCWFDNVLIMDDLAGQRDGRLWVNSAGIIASYDVCFGLTIYSGIELLRKASVDVEQEIANAIKESDTYTQLIADIYSPNARNDLHDRRKRESLVKWLEENVHLNLYVHFENANDEDVSKYTCIILTIPPELNDPDKLHVPRSWYAHSPEEWAKMYLCKDDAVIVRFSLIEVIYSICHCRYVEKYNAIRAVPGDEEFYAPLDYAYDVIEKLYPKNNDCYRLARYYINKDNGDVELKEDITTKCAPLIIFNRFKKVHPEIYKVDAGDREVELVLTNKPWLSFVYGCYISTATDRGGNKWLVKWEKKTDWRHAAPSYAELIEVRYYKYTEDFENVAPVKEPE